MVYEKSCGFIAYKEQQNKRLYLIIRAHSGEYGFPKGHIEHGETEYETAMRELKEETNAEVQIIDGFRRQIEYELPNKRNTMKQVVYFLGKCKNDNLACQISEVAEVIFAPLETALELLSFEEAKRLLKEADFFIAKGV